MEVKQRRAAVDRRRPALSVVRQCNLLDISRSGLYYQPIGVSDEDLSLMKLIDRQYMVTPFYGTRKMAAWLKSKHYSINRKHVRRQVRSKCSLMVGYDRMFSGYLKDESV